MDFRERLLDLVRNAVEPLSDVLAMIEGGSAAFGRADEYSDADAHVVVKDTPEAVATTFAVVESALNDQLHLTRRWSLPEPAWHGHSQRIYQFAGEAPWRWLDLAVMRAGAADLFTAPEQHGQQRILFDKTGIADPPAFEASAFREQMRTDLAHIVDEFDALQPLVEKQSLRGSSLAAITYYRGRTLAPLTKALAMLYAPLRYTHGVNYIAPDFPDDVRRDLERLSFVSDLADLVVKHKTAIAMFHETISQIDVDAIDLEGLSEHVRGSGAR
jgi:hypothetical protein